MYATLAAPAGTADADRIATATIRLGDPGLALEMAGVVFAFNAVNRVADARRVRLEYRFLRELRPVPGWMERRFASLTGLVYDLTYVQEPRHAPDAVLDRLRVLFQGFGAPGVPEVFTGLRPAPLVLEGISEMIEVNARNPGVRVELWKEAIAIAVASRATSDSGLIPMVDGWLAQGSLPDSATLLALAASPGSTSAHGLASACRRYAWRVANAAHAVSDEEIGRLHALGLSDANVLDLTLGSALFSALAIVEPLIAAVETAPLRWDPPPRQAPSGGVSSCRPTSTLEPLGGKPDEVSS